VSSDFDSDIYRLSVGYSFIKDDKAEVRVVPGAHVTDFKLSLNAAGVGSEKSDTLAPLPTIGLYGSYAFTPRWLLSARVDYFSLNYGDYDGQLVNTNVGVDYRVARNIAIGLGYRYVDYDLTLSKSAFNGGIRYKFNGPTLYMVGSF
jgi:opacity protein-like surface antigen